MYAIDTRGVNRYMKRMGRKKTLADCRPVHLLFPGELLDAIDAWIAETAASLPPGATINRSTLIRATMQAAVDARRRGSIVTPSK